MANNSLKLIPYASTEDAQKDGAGRVGGGGDDAEVSFFNGPSIQLYFHARILGCQL